MNGVRERNKSLLCERSLVFLRERSGLARLALTAAGEGRSGVGSVVASSDAATYRKKERSQFSATLDERMIDGVERTTEEGGEIVEVDGRGRKRGERGD